RAPDRGRGRSRARDARAGAAPRRRRHPAREGRRVRAREAPPRAARRRTSGARDASRPRVARGVLPRPDRGGDGMSAFVEHVFDRLLYHARFVALAVLLAFVVLLFTKRGRRAIATTLRRIGRLVHVETQKAVGGRTFWTGLLAVVVVTAFTAWTHD